MDKASVLIDQIHPGRPHDMTALATLAERHPHGTRVRYMTGCRCIPCRAANSRYESERLRARATGDWNGLVSASTARKHIFRLSRLGVGRAQVADAAGVSRTAIAEIRAGRKMRIRARTERRILAVTRDAVADHSIVPATRTWWMIRRLQKDGFSKREIARRLGFKTLAIQFRKDFVLAKTESRVERFLRVIYAGDSVPLPKPRTRCA